MDFCFIVVVIVEVEVVFDVKIVNGFYYVLVFKLVNIRINEFMNVRMEREFKI